MKKFLFLLALVAAFTANAQVSTGSIQVSNYGDHYRISHIGTVVNNIYPKPDSASLVIIIYCPKSGQSEVNHVPLNATLKYKMGGTHYIASSVIWWRNGVKRSQTDMKTICGWFANPLECFQKL